MFCHFWLFPTLGDGNFCKLLDAIFILAFPYPVKNDPTNNKILNLFPFP